MFRKLLPLLLSALSLGACRAQTAQKDQSLLWRVSGNGLPKPSYLFGTIHLLCPEDYVWTPAMSNSLKHCSKVCFELDMDDPKVLAAAMNASAGADDKLLRDYFTAEQYGRLDRFVKDTLHSDLSVMQHMKPIMLQSLFMMKAVSCTVPVSYEANILEEAQRHKMDVIGLEVPQEQLDVLNGLPDDSVVKEILQMTDSFSASRAQYQDMLAAYKRQDLPALFRIIQESESSGEDMGPLLDERNAKWIPRMVPQMRRSPVFFAVGAGHLAGRAGIINLLRKAGYKVEAVR